jgi:hypothetical protein
VFVGDSLIGAGQVNTAEEARQAAETVRRGSYIAADLLN